MSPPTHTRRRPSVALALALAPALVLGGGCGPRPSESDPARPSVETSPAAIDPVADGSAEWVTSLGSAGSVRLRWRGVDLMRVQYPFWGADWKWANPTVTEAEGDTTGSAFRIEVPGLSTTIDAVARAVDPGVLEVRFTARVGRDLVGTIGGGPEFHLLSDVIAQRPGYTPPQLLPGQRGFAWTAIEGQTVTVRFDPPPARVYFEQGRREQIRAFVLGPGTKAGTHQMTMRVELPEGGAVGPSLSQRYAAGNDPWFPATMEWDRIPVDLRHLNDGHRPAGTHGPIEARGDGLVFADGTPARLWGTNVVAYSIFSADRDSVAAQARRLAALGFNLVRIHHHDSHWVEPNIFAVPKTETQRLSDESLARLDWWIKCLQDEGIYVWLDLHVGRHLRAGDRVPAFSEVAAREGELKGFNYVNPRIEALMKGFATRYLDRDNRYTGRRYADDPGLMGVLITNENDITHHFGNLMNEDSGAPEHRKMLQALVEPFAEAKGLPVDAAMQPWSYGPAKVAMNELEARFHRRFIEHLRAIGVRAPVATTSFWGDDPLASLPALTVGDVIDLHSYGGEGELEVDPRLSHNFIHRLVAGRVEGMPTTITEWNLLPPVRDRFVGAIWLAAVASLQGWDAPMHYSYTSTPLPPPDRLYDGMGLVDPATMALMPAAALAFRQGHVAPAKARYRIVLDRAHLYDQEMGAHRSAAIRTLSEQSRVEIALPDLPELDWDTPRRRRASPGAIEVRDLHRSFLPEEATTVVSDTGQLRRDWIAGVGTLDTPQTQAAYGWIGGRTIALGDVELQIDTPKAAVAVSALDGRPIRESTELLVSVAAQVQGSDGKPPLRAQAVSGRLRIRSTHSRLTMRPVTEGSRGAAKHAGAEQPGTAEGEHQSFRLPPLPTHWYRITPG